MSITILPVDILRYLQEFANINELFHTCQSFYKIKKYVYIWRLNKEYSYKYYQEHEFRILVQSKMCETFQQLCINLCYNQCLICDNVENLDNLHELNVAYTNFTAADINKLNNVGKLTVLNVIHTLK